MKSAVILFAGCEPGHNFEKVFEGKSSFELCLSWAESVPDCCKIIILVNKESRAAIEPVCSKKSNISFVEKENWTNADVAHAVADQTSSCGADYAVYTWGDCPFINKKITEQEIRDHIEYKAEYTFADGFAYGLTPEVIDKGAASIIAALTDGPQKAAGEKNASRDGFFSIMSGDINSFEIETVLADKDYRMLRFEFECSSKAGLTACTRLFEAAKEKLCDRDSNLSDLDVYKLSDLAEGMASIQKTLPHFYNLQLSSKSNTKSLYNPAPVLLKDKKLSDMSFENFKALVKKISDFSEEAYISLSLFGEPSCNEHFVDCVKEVLSYKKLHLFIETDGINLTEETVSKIASSSPDAVNRIDWAVQLDSVDEAMYLKINGLSDGSFEKATKSVLLLEKYFETHVYPQFTRMNANEEQLESFFRFWNNRENPSKGQLVIMKYDSCAGLLSDEKPADLSPLERNACWHLRRDMNILSDGTVIMCRTRAGEILGNAFGEDLEKIWEKQTGEVEDHIKENYCEKCKACDEYYTFNF